MYKNIKQLRYLSVIGLLLPVAIWIFKISIDGNYTDDAAGYLFSSIIIFVSLAAAGSVALNNNLQEISGLLCATCAGLYGFAFIVFSIMLIRGFLVGEGSLFYIWIPAIAYLAYKAAQMGMQIEAKEFDTTKTKPAYVPAPYFNNETSESLKEALLNLSTLKREDLAQYTFAERMTLVDEARHAIKHGVYPKLNIWSKEPSADN